MPDSFYFGLVFTAVAIFVGHWFRWPQGDLHRLLAYAWGVSCILTGQGIWLLIHPERSLPAGISGTSVWLAVASFAIIAGVATGLAWLIDDELKLAMKDHIDARRTDKSD